MSNKTAALSLSLSYPKPSGTSVTESLSVASLFQGQNVGTFDVPDTTVGGAQDIPFGSVAKATLLIVRNRTGQDCTVKVNAADTVYDLPDGGVVIISSANFAASNPLSAAALTTTGVQAGDGAIDYWVFGDPTA